MLAEALETNPWPQFFTLDQYRHLIRNGRKVWVADDYEAYPVARLFTPDGDASWLIAEINPLDTSIAFGLCDL